MSDTFKIRRGTENTMKTIKSNTVLADGEIFAEVPNTGVGTGKGRLVMGDGVTTYNNLPSFIENTDVSSAAVTITADNSTTSSAALNNVTSGNSTGALIGSLKQAITLTKSELNEIYQRSPVSGFGGIRYNDETKTIQLIDTNNNWVNWKRFDAYAQFKHIANRTGTGAFNYTFEESGMYVLQGSSYNSQVGGLLNISSNSRSIELISMNGYACFIFIADSGDTLSFNQTGQYGPTFILCFLGHYEGANLINYQTGTNSTTATISVTGVHDRVLVGTSSGSSVGPLSYSSTSPNTFASAPRVCCSLLNGDSDDGYITCKGGASGSGSIPFVTEIQVY